MTVCSRTVYNRFYLRSTATKIQYRRATVQVSAALLGVRRESSLPIRDSCIGVWHVHKENVPALVALMHRFVDEGVVEAKGTPWDPLAGRLASDREPGPFSAQRKVASEPLVGRPCVRLKPCARLQHVPSCA